MAGARGEGVIELTDHQVPILFTNRALADAEAKLGRAILATLQGLVDGTTGITEMVVLLQVGMQAAKRDAGERPFAVTLNEAYDVMDEAGFTAVTAAVAEASAAVLTYSHDEAGEGEGPNPQ